MNIWLEIMGTYPEREGKYLICPIHSSTKQNYHLYRILEDLQPDDIVFHYVLQKASKRPSAFKSFSHVKNRAYIAETQDSLCPYPPPYRKVELCNNTPLLKPITKEMLMPYKDELVLIADASILTRMPFDKNFRIKQLYLSRIPKGFMEIFSKLTKQKFTFM